MRLNPRRQSVKTVGTRELHDRSLSFFLSLLNYPLLPDTLDFTSCHDRVKKRLGLMLRHRSDSQSHHGVFKDSLIKGSSSLRSIRGAGLPPYVIPMEIQTSASIRFGPSTGWGECRPVDNGHVEGWRVEDGGDGSAANSGGPRTRQLSVPVGLDILGRPALHRIAIRSELLGVSAA